MLSYICLKQLDFKVIMRPFKFQWQKVKNELLGPGFTSVSPHCIIKVETQRYFSQNTIYNTLSISNKKYNDI